MYKVGLAIDIIPEKGVNALFIANSHKIKVKTIRQVVKLDTTQNLQRVHIMALMLR